MGKFDLFRIYIFPLTYVSIFEKKSVFFEFTRILILCIMEIQNNYYIGPKTFKQAYLHFYLRSVQSLKINAANSFIHFSLNIQLQDYCKLAKLFEIRKLGFVNKEIVTPHYWNHQRIMSTAEYHSKFRFLTIQLLFSTTYIVFSSRFISQPGMQLHIPYIIFGCYGTSIY